MAAMAFRLRRIVHPRGLRSPHAVLSACPDFGRFCETDMFARRKII